MSSPRPLYQRPLELGADIVVYSATKHIDGQGRCLGGLILGSKELIEADIQNYLRQTGPILSPFNAWVMLKALETLPLRVGKQAENATKVADWLAAQSKPTKVIFPGHKNHPQAEIIKRQMSGPSTMIAFEVPGGKEGAYRLLDACKLIRISNNLGDAKSLIVHPATTTHQRFTPEVRAAMGVSDGLVRLSIGLEHHDDLIADLEQALAKV
jgi:O-succinylhomoserine sulfhydrylase